jgi:hypothetical protein
MSIQELLKLSDYDVGIIAAFVVIIPIYYYGGILEVVYNPKKYQKWCDRVDKLRSFILRKVVKK